jgi:hypothetical protein
VKAGAAEAPARGVGPIVDRRRGRGNPTDAKQTFHQRPATGTGTDMSGQCVELSIVHDRTLPWRENMPRIITFSE